MTPLTKVERRVVGCQAAFLDQQSAFFRVNTEGELKREYGPKTTVRIGDYDEEGEWPQKHRWRKPS